MLVLAVFARSSSSYGTLSVSISLLRFLPNMVQHTHASSQFRRRDVVKQLMTQFERRRADLFDDPLSTGRQMHRLATAIVRRVFPRDPVLAFQAVQQGHKRWFFDPEMRGNLGLGQWTGRHR